MYALRALPALGVLLGLASAAPAVTRDVTVPTTNGFPSPNAQQLVAINKKADGQISNAPPPPKIANSSLTAFQLIAFNELFEVAFFNSLAQNVTNNVTGFEVGHMEKHKLLNILDTVIAVSDIFPAFLEVSAPATNVNRSKKSFMRLAPFRSSSTLARSPRPLASTRSPPPT